ncbi:MAG: hypothetical protein V4622_01305 [Bacteroidota bacterium]
MKNIFFQILCLTTVILFFKNLEDLFISLNFSWTFSKITPYFLLIILGFTLMFKIRRLLIIKIPFIRLIALILIFIFPFGLGFALNPIYEGDFSKNGKEIKNEQTLSDFQKFDFVVLTIPDCPYCHETINSINLLQKRNPNLTIKYIVCSSENRQIEPYRFKLNSKIQVSLAQNLSKMIEIANGSFPFFVKLNQDGIYTWSNNEFGVRAKDFLESEL